MVKYRYPLYGGDIMKKLSIFVSILFLIACGQTFNEQHVTFLEDEGWHIKEFVSEEIMPLDVPEEMLANYEASGITFIRAYQGQEVTQFIYNLKEKDTDGDSLKAVLYEIDGEVIGGHGVMSNWIPGLFDLTDQERLISDNMIKQ